LKGKRDNGGKLITQEQVDQCIAFVKGDFSNYKATAELSK